MKSEASLRSVFSLTPFQMTIEILSFSPETLPLRDEFIDFPYELYSSIAENNWIPPLRQSQEKLLSSRHNPFLKASQIRLFLAKKGMKTVGRIAAIQNPEWDDFHPTERTGFYGFFECENHPETAKQLFESASNWLLKKGYTQMMGPVNPSVHHECGLLIRGQSQHPTLGTTWNPRYYVDLHEQNGFQTAKDLVAYALRVEQDEILSTHRKSVDSQARTNDRIHFRNFNVRRFEEDVKLCHEIYTAAWEKNWGFYPPSLELFQSLAQEMRPILDPRFAFIAEVDGQPAGFMLAIPDYNRIFKRIPDGRLFPTGWLKLLIGRLFLKSVRIITLGVKPEFRNQGIFTAFTLESFRRARKHGIRGGEASWILEDNDGMTRPWEAIGAPLYRRWRLYQRTFTEKVTIPSPHLPEGVLGAIERSPHP